MPMTFAEYAEKAATTAIFPPEQGPAYTTLGLCSEVAELVEAHANPDAPTGQVMAEVGDALWYLAMVARTCNLQPPIDLGQKVDWVSVEDSLSLLVQSSGHLAGRVKKRIRDGHDAVPDTTIEQAIVDSVSHLAAIAAHLGSYLPTIAQGNLDKLADRQRRGALSGSGDNR